LRQQIAMVTQEVILFDDTVANNIAVGRPGASREEIIQAAQRANAHAFIEQMPQGYDSEIGERGVRLSGGQRQRLAIARALIHDPPVLVFDEATSALDPESEAIIQQHLGAISHGRTIIIISHRLSFVARSHQIIVIDQGRIAQIGTHDALLRGCLPYNQLWSQQARVYQ
jgi:ABC-type multidrug transport system fused ATPase/permease subunit